MIKHHSADGAMYYSEVGSYPPSAGGFFDLGGNVAEWVDQIPDFSIEDQIDAYIDSCYVYAEQWESVDLSAHLEKAEYNKKLVDGSKIALVKGGSWADGLAYIQIGSREARANDAKSSRIGFRIAVSDPGDKYRKYFPKKAWTP